MPRTWVCNQEALTTEIATKPQPGISRDSSIINQMKKNRSTMTVLRPTLAAAIAGAAVQVASAQSQPAAITNAPPPPPSWPTTAALGLTLTRGNSDTTTFTANINSEQKTK